MNQTHLDRYRTIIASLASQALDLAKAASSSKPSPTDQASLSVALPAAHVLLRHVMDQPIEPQLVDELNQSIASLTACNDNLRDSFGFTRPAYRALAQALTATAANQLNLTPAIHTTQSNTASSSDDLDLALLSSRPPNNSNNITAALRVDEAGPLRPFDESKELLDVWWFRELVAIHGLAHFALAPNAEPAITQRLQTAVMHHVDNTQPDHTTAQPWGVAAFAFFPEALPFADQQLHDAQSNWTATGPASALLPGLILADAANTLANIAQTTASSS